MISFGAKSVIKQANTPVVVSFPGFINREVKHDVYGKRQTAKIELLVSDFSRLYNLGKLFAFTVIKGFFSYFSTGFI